MWSCRRQPWCLTRCWAEGQPAEAAAVLRTRLRRSTLIPTYPTICATCRRAGCCPSRAKEAPEMDFSPPPCACHPPSANACREIGVLCCFQADSWVLLPAGGLAAALHVRGCTQDGAFTSSASAVRRAPAAEEVLRRHLRALLRRLRGRPGGLSAAGPAAAAEHCEARGCTSGVLMLGCVA